MKLEKPLKILVRREAAVGDVIMSTAVVRELKLLYGENVVIDVITAFPDVYRNNPHVCNVWLVTSPPDINEYQIYINLDDAYETNPTQHYVENYFYRAFGHNQHNHSVELWPTEQDQAAVDADRAELTEKFIVVHMRHWHWGAKNISPDTWLEVFRRCFAVRTDFNIVCVGKETDLYVDHPLIFDGRNGYNIQQLSYLMNHARCFVGIDSGPYWCAAASQTHIVALLTHLRPEVILPYRKIDDSYGKINCTPIQTLEDCRGCNDKQFRPVRKLNCIKETFPCTNNWNIESIVDAILKNLEN